jgi:hypothetical protein
LQFQAELPVKSPADLHFLNHGGCLAFTRNATQRRAAESEGTVKKLQVRKTGPVRLTSTINPMYVSLCRI